jgi:hypothetical protein
VATRFSSTESAGKDLPALGHKPNAGLRDSIGWQPKERAALERRFARARRHNPHDGVDRGGLAHAIAAEEGDDFAGTDREIHIEQHLRRTIACREPSHLQHWFHSSSSPR